VTERINDYQPEFCDRENGASGKPEYSDTRLLVADQSDVDAL